MGTWEHKLAGVGMWELRGTITSYTLCVYIADMIVVVASLMVLSVGSEGQVFAASAIRYIPPSRETTKTVSE